RYPDRGCGSPVMKGPGQQGPGPRRSVTSVAASSGPGRETVEAAQRGDTHAQDELVAAYLPLVYNIVGRALNGHPDVDDVVQETMLRALAALGSLEDPDGFRSWLVAIAMNQLRRHWRDHRTAPASAALHDAYDVA